MPSPRPAPRYRYRLPHQVKNSSFTVFISHLTANTYIMVVTTSPLVEKATTELNINAARKHFQRLLRQPGRPANHQAELD